MALFCNDLDESINEVLRRTGPHVILGIPLGIGKPNLWVNRLYQTIAKRPDHSLKIITALSLLRPQAKSDLEARFLEPFAERVFGNYPDLDYAHAVKSGTLPPNIEVCEFFFKTAEMLNNAEAQQHYICSNYTHVARDMMHSGVNVLAQEIGVLKEGEHTRYSMGSNPDVSLDIREALLEYGQRDRVVMVGVVNHLMPFMPHGAEIQANDLDMIVETEETTHTLFAPPNMKVALADHVIGLYASSLVEDGGTLQIGIGSLGDAIANALIVRHTEPETYQKMLEALPPGSQPLPQQTGTFHEGLYGCSEMFVNGFLQLHKAGILRRKVYDDVRLQKLLNEKIIVERISPDILEILRSHGLINEELNPEHLQFLYRFGIITTPILIEGNSLLLNGQSIPNRLSHPETQKVLRMHLGTQLKGGIYMHGGFFIGPGDFYQTLREMPETDLYGIHMGRISFINQLYGQEKLAQVQRRKARFINTTMMMTLLGAAVSDGLENGHLVSGVGGQYNFVAMSHALPDSRSILMLRAVRETADGPQSNIVWNYGHVTIPRHLRDIVITEYGIANLRGQTDQQIIERLICIADSRFQADLMYKAKAAGKLRKDWLVPEWATNNRPEILKHRLATWTGNVLPDFPFGTDFTDDELHIVHALTQLKASVSNPIDLVKTLISSVFRSEPVPDRYLERMNLDHPQNLKQRLMRQLFSGNL